MTFNDLVERAKRQLSAGQPEPRTWAESEIDIAACVMQASSAVAHMVMRDNALRPLLQQEYSVTLSGGEGNLLTAVGSVTGTPGEILLEGVDWGAVIDADNNTLVPILHYQQFIAPLPVQFAYYHKKDKATILTRALGSQVNNVSELQSVTGPLTITASYDPADVEDFPEELAENLVHELVRIVALKTYTDVKTNAAA